MNITMRLTGHDKLEKTLRAMGPGATKALGAEMYREAVEIMRASQEIVPVDTGVLKGSGHVVPPEYEGERVLVTLGYGGAAVKYAIYVHERPDAWHEPPTQWKYLEQPFTEAKTGMLQRIADNLWHKWMTKLVKGT